jgi:hypothetical protein
MSWSFVGGFACGVFTCIAIHWFFGLLETWALIHEARRSQADTARRGLDIQTHEEWRRDHPNEHPLWCQYTMTGKLQPCDCDLANSGGADDTAR